MKQIFLTCFIIGSYIAVAQPKIVDHAIIITKAKLTILNPAEKNAEQSTPFGTTATHIKSENGLSEGNNRIEAFYKGDKIKVISDLGMGTSTMIIDKKNNTTTTLINIMGIKTGFYTTNEILKELQRLKDSINKKTSNQLRNNNDSIIILGKDSLKIHIDYFEENKTIAGFACKKALIKTTHSNRKTDSVYAWYCPDFKLKETFNDPIGLPAFILLNGFPMQYEIINRKGNKVGVEVKKINLTKEIKDEEFEVPKDYDLHPMKLSSQVNSDI